MATFNEDRSAASVAELLVLNTFSAMTDKYIFRDVTNNPECYYKGDILAIERATGREIWIEVKNDSRIAETRNVLCEEEYWSDYHQEIIRGNMQCDGDIYCVVSQSERKIYVIDYALLRAKYKNGIYKIIQHETQATFCYLCSLHQITEWGAGITVIEY